MRQAGYIELFNPIELVPAGKRMVMFLAAR